MPKCATNILSLSSASRSTLNRDSAGAAVVPRGDRHCGGCCGRDCGRRGGGVAREGPAAVAIVGGDGGNGRVVRGRGGGGVGSSGMG